MCPWCICTGHQTLCKNLFSTSTMQVTGLNLSPSDVSASACSAYSPSPVTPVSAVSQGKVNKRERERARANIFTMEGWEPEMVHKDLFIVTLTLTLPCLEEKKVQIERKESKKNESTSPSSSCALVLGCTLKHWTYKNRIIWSQKNVSVHVGSAQTHVHLVDFHALA